MFFLSLVLLFIIKFRFPKNKSIKNVTPVAGAAPVTARVTPAILVATNGQSLQIATPREIPIIVMKHKRSMRDFTAEFSFVIGAASW